MDSTQYPTNLQNLIYELESRFSNFKKRDVFKAVNNSFQKIRPAVYNITPDELEEIKEMAVSDLNA